MENKYSINYEDGTVNCNECGGERVALPHNCYGTTIP